MRELSLHALDIVQNSIAAGATRIVVGLEADKERDTLTMRIRDDGRGMDPEFAASISDPFVTTRTTRKVGLGIPMLRAAARMCNGDVTVDSKPGAGTVVQAMFELGHVDRQPVGDILSTMITLIAANPEISFRYEHQLNGSQFVLDTDEVKAELQDVPINDPGVVSWLREFMAQGISLAGQVS